MTVPELSSEGAGNADAGCVASSLPPAATEQQQSACTHAEPVHAPMSTLEEPVYAHAMIASSDVTCAGDVACPETASMQSSACAPHSESPLTNGSVAAENANAPSYSDSVVAEPTQSLAENAPDEKPYALDAGDVAVASFFGIAEHVLSTAASSAVLDSSVSLHAHVPVTTETLSGEGDRASGNDVAATAEMPRTHASTRSENDAPAHVSLDATHEMQGVESAESARERQSSVSSTRDRAQRVPDGWHDYDNFGEPIGNTRIIALKTPLDEDFDTGESRRFTCADFIEAQGKLGRRIGLVVDLTNTTRYYNAKHFIDAGIEYRKIMCIGHEIPSGRVVSEFFDALNSFFARTDNTDALAAVHCTHGVNRTGFLVCLYLVHVRGMQPADALALFSQFRPPGIQRQTYSDHLMKGEQPSTAPSEPAAEHLRDAPPRRQSDDRDRERARSPDRHRHRSRSPNRDRDRRLSHGRRSPPPRVPERPRSPENDRRGRNEKAAEIDRYRPRYNDRDRPQRRPSPSPPPPRGRAHYDDRRREYERRDNDRERERDSRMAPREPLYGRPPAHYDTRPHGGPPPPPQHAYAHSPPHNPRPHAHLPYDGPRPHASLPHAPPAFDAGSIAEHLRHVQQSSRPPSHAPERAHIPSHPPAPAPYQHAQPYTAYPQPYPSQSLAAPPTHFGPPGYAQPDAGVPAAPRPYGGAPSTAYSPISAPGYGALPHGAPQPAAGGIPTAQWAQSHVPQPQTPAYGHTAPYAHQVPQPVFGQAAPSYAYAAPPAPAASYAAQPHLLSSPVPPPAAPYASSPPQPAYGGHYRPY